MNLALFAHPGLRSPLLGLLRWLSPAPSASAPGLAPADKAVRAPQAEAGPNEGRVQRSSRTCTPNSRLVPVRRPLRVVRILEAGQPRSQVGRMVMSGRLADVCAELDRLVACEAARH